MASPARSTSSSNPLPPPLPSRKESQKKPVNPVPTVATQLAQATSNPTTKAPDSQPTSLSTTHQVIELTPLPKTFLGSGNYFNLRTTLAAFLEQVLYVNRQKEFLERIKSTNQHVATHIAAHVTRHVDDHNTIIKTQQQNYSCLYGEVDALGSKNIQKMKGQEKEIRDLEFKIQLLDSLVLGKSQLYHSHGNDYRLNEYGEYVSKLSSIIKSDQSDLLNKAQQNIEKGCIIEEGKPFSVFILAAQPSGIVPSELCKTLLDMLSRCVVLKESILIAHQALEKTGATEPSEIEHRKNLAIKTNLSHAQSLGELRKEIERLNKDAQNRVKAIDLELAEERLKGMASLKIPDLVKERAFIQTCLPFIKVRSEEIESYLLEIRVFYDFKEEEEKANTPVTLETLIENSKLLDNMQLIVSRKEIAKFYLAWINSSYEVKITTDDLIKLLAFEQFASKKIRDSLEDTTKTHNEHKQRLTTQLEVFKLNLIFHRQLMANHKHAEDILKEIGNNLSLRQTWKIGTSNNPTDESTGSSQSLLVELASKASLAVSSAASVFTSLITGAPGNTPEQKEKETKGT